MKEAGESLKRDESKPAATAERDAADRLGKLRDSMQERSMGGAEQHRDPVRIPGADESSAPRAWRQELLDAMKEKGARALPRRGPPLLRGAGQMKRGLTALAVAALSLAGARRRARRPTARPRPRPPSDLGAAAKQVDALLDAWQFKEAAAALATLKSAAPGRARDELPRRLPEVPRRRLRRRGPRALRGLRRAAGQRRRSSRSRSWPPPRATPSRTSARSARPTRSSTTRPRTPRSSPTRATPSRRRTRRCTPISASRSRSRSGSSSIAPRPIWRRSRRCRWPRWRAPGRSRSASGRA